MPKPCTVALTQEDRQTLEALLRQGGLSFRQCRRVCASIGASGWPLPA
jgi:hypothetical protein